MAVHGLAATAVLLANMSLAWQLAALLFIAGHGLYLRHATGWLRRLRQVDYCDGECQLYFSDGSSQVLEARAELVTGPLILLRMGSGRYGRILPLFADATDADAFRRLRVWLRCRDMNRPTAG